MHLDRAEHCFVAARLAMGLALRLRLVRPSRPFASPSGSLGSLGALGFLTCKQEAKRHEAVTGCPDTSPTARYLGHVSRRWRRLELVGPARLERLPPQALQQRPQLFGALLNQGAQQMCNKACTQPPSQNGKKWRQETDRLPNKAERVQVRALKAGRELPP